MCLVLGRLSGGMDLPRLKHAELVNTVLRVDKVSFKKKIQLNVHL